MGNRLTNLTIDERRELNNPIQAPEKDKKDLPKAGQSQTDCKAGQLRDNALGYDKRKRNVRLKT